MPSLSSSLAVINNETNVHALRLGMSGEWHLGAGVWIGAEAAWVPYAWINAEDDHLLRPFVATEIGGAPSNVQIEGWLRYQATSALSLALGGRYWKFDSTNAHSFRNDIFFDQAISLHTERWGGFLQASYKFGDLQPSGRPTASH